jgi:VIT1/CCC1 family predicted Fe2+/Mn2+ transporter
MHKPVYKHINGDYFRSMLFGCEDALVSTTGVVAGVAVATSNTQFILLAAIVTIIVEAISMGAGEYLSEKAVYELEKTKKASRKANPIVGGTLMFLSYFFAGFIPVIPVMLFAPTTATVVSVVSALIGLYILGYVKGKVVGRSATKSAFEVFLVGGIAAAIGIIAGIFLRI